MTMTHGDSKDHRPDLKPAGLALLVSPDGGVPLVRQRGDGQTSDLQMFQARAQALRPALTHTPSPRDLGAEATRAHEDQASSLPGIGCIPRLANPLGVVSPVIRPALAWNTWQPGDDNLRAQALAWCHEGMAQRGLVVDAPAARERAAATFTQATPRDRQASTTPRFHLHAQRFWAPSAAHAARAA